MGAFPTVGLEYDEALRSVGVAAERWPECRKWVRFYLHFCGKYGQEVAAPGSLPASWTNWHRRARAGAAAHVRDPSTAG